jgi:hypothetical protein
MAFTNYTIVPVDGVVVLDGVAYQPVDMTGIPATVHAIVWNGVTSTGQIQYKQLSNGTLPTPGTFSSAADYFNQTEACESPLVVYALADGTVYNSVTYSEGQQLTIYQYPNPAVPAGFTETAPLGGSSAYDYPQWNGTAWIQAPFPIAYNLVQAQTFLTSLVNANASALVNNQVRNYSTPQLFAAASVDALLPADSVSNLYPTIGDYQTAVNAEIAAQLASISAATAVNQLYTFDPTVSTPPNYVP